MPYHFSKDTLVFPFFIHSPSVPDFASAAATALWMSFPELGFSRPSSENGSLWYGDCCGKPNSFAVRRIYAIDASFVARDQLTKRARSKTLVGRYSSAQRAPTLQYIYHSTTLPHHEEEPTRTFKPRLLPERQRSSSSGDNSKYRGTGTTGRTAMGQRMFLVVSRKSSSINYTVAKTDQYPRNADLQIASR